jgi:hypothetical protein
VVSLGVDNARNESPEELSREAAALLLGGCFFDQRVLADRNAADRNRAMLSILFGRALHVNVLVEQSYALGWIDLQSQEDSCRLNRLRISWYLGSLRIGSRIGSRRNMIFGRRFGALRRRARQALSSSPATR